MADRLVIPLVRWEPRPASCYPERKPGPLPQRMALLASDARESLRPIEHLLVVSDCYRDPAASLAAYAAGRRGVAPPGFSAHNYGLAIDFDVTATIRRLTPARAKAALDDVLAGCGWRCYRSDGRIGPEAWHYTYGALDYGSSGIDAEIVRRFGLPRVGRPLSAAMRDRCRALLAGEDVRDFQRRWGLLVAGEIGPRTARTILVATADVRIGGAP